MLFDQGQFLVFLPISIIIYYTCPKRFQNVVLLAECLLFAFCQSTTTLVAVIVYSFLTYFFSILFERSQHKKIAVSFLISVFIILWVIFRIRFQAPLGISFYSLRLIGYSLDIYKGEKAEKKLLFIMLYVSYFPILPAGPIEKSAHFFCELKTSKMFNQERAYKGFITLLCGYFMKIVIADRCAILVDTVYNGYAEYSGMICLIVVIFYSLQIYCDFAGYSIIAKGISEIMGIDIMNNFKRPYMAEGIRDFWRRWHISLSTWLREYVYIPLGGNRKGKFRKELNVMITFLVSGLWHGLSLNFVLWGLLHGAFQVLEDIMESLFRRVGFDFKLKSIINTFVTFVAVSVAWIFFRITDVRMAAGFIVHMAENMNNHSLNNNIFMLGWGRLQIVGILLACGVLGIVELMIEKKSITLEKFCSLSTHKRTTICYLFMLWIVIVVIQMYGIGQEKGFIYASF